VVAIPDYQTEMLPMLSLAAEVEDGLEDDRLATECGTGDD